MFFNIKMAACLRRMQRCHAGLLPVGPIITQGAKMDKNTPMISYAAHEGMMARMERTIRRLWILCIILIILLAGTNAAWIWYENQFMDESLTVTQDLDSGNGGDAVINDGVHINGESETDSNP